jgi:hypothetical protein
MKKYLATPYLRSQTERQYKYIVIAYTVFWMIMTALVGFTP